VWSITWRDLEEGSGVTTLLTRVQRDLSLDDRILDVVGDEGFAVVGDCDRAGSAITDASAIRADSTRADARGAPRVGKVGRSRSPS